MKIRSPSNNKFMDTLTDSIESIGERINDKKHRIGKDDKKHRFGQDDKEDILHHHLGYTTVTPMMQNQ